jgi:hypothetical protein
MHRFSIDSARGPGYCLSRSSCVLFSSVHSAFVGACRGKERRNLKTEPSHTALLLVFGMHLWIWQFLDVFYGCGHDVVVWGSK